MPALLTSTSTGPWCSSTSVNARSTAAASVTSHCTPNSPSGAPLPRWVTATESPASANDRAIASPIPRLPPVTSTDLPTVPHPALVLPTVQGNLSGRRRSHLREPGTGHELPVGQSPRLGDGADQGRGGRQGRHDELGRVEHRRPDQLGEPGEVRVQRPADAAVEHD